MRPPSKKEKQKKSDQKVLTHGEKYSDAALFRIRRWQKVFWGECRNSSYGRNARERAGFGRAAKAGEAVRRIVTKGAEFQSLEQLPRFYKKGKTP